MCQENKNLLEEINQRRSKLFDTAGKNGLTNEETIKSSQELDQLIFQYQQMIHCCTRKTIKKIYSKDLVIT